MNEISIDDVKKLARLSALTVSEEEAEALRSDLTQILGYVDQLSAVDTEGTVPSYQAHDLQTVTRQDAIKDYGVTQEELLKNAPSHDAGNVIVPRVLE